MKQVIQNIFLIIAVFVSFSLSAQKLQFKENTEGITLTEDNLTRFHYQTTTKSLNGNYPRANYVHPLYGLDGEVLTEDFPEDHFHHRGIFWTWHQLYVDGKRIADPWFCEGISWKVNSTEQSIHGNKATIQSTVLWLADSLQNEPVLEEMVNITFERLKEDAYSITFEITMTALVDELAFGGSEDAKGYGGFSPRIKLPEDVTFHSEGKTVTPQNLPIKAGPWMNLKGTFDGKKPANITIMGEPDKLPSYQGWILRSANSMQNMAFPGNEPTALPKSKPVHFSNMILVHRQCSTEEIDEYYRQFRQD
ncbi:hypothetical protein DN752_21275 [Echinicola strongylocentroti]|uniref:Methane oxygenase PmoA n=1 Tax=Echinicola strongylocentroti TaxID=1795355 RepID=A0A2Z4IQA4_9BACT|nr:DUF6807 family protein [Echinicola strongylocentroti]AWW32473.1 hypothetical protein DN752_21275 [Echinicola strongylocentroti]